MIETLIIAAAGYVAGAFTPSIGRKIKALFVKEANAAKASAGTAVSTAASSALASVVATAEADIAKAIAAIKAAI
jgi:hypothetical protein